jgi:RNA polymerase sigma-70 factor (ECF subfamily)
MAEDLVSDVFLDVWRAADKFRGKCKLSTWVLAIARHKAFSALRKRSEDHLEQDEWAMIEDPAEGVDSFAADAGRGTLLRECLGKLSAAHREVIDLVYYHEKSVEEAAVIIGIPPATVKTRMFYARSRMRELLEAAGIESSF